MDKPLNVAVIGCGMLARSTHIANLARSAQAALHTCCNLSDGTLNKCRTTYGSRPSKWSEQNLHTAASTAEGEHES